MKKWTVATFQAAKGRQKLGCCTAYDACFAHLADAAGVPCILVGDSMGMTMLGYGTTLRLDERPEKPWKRLEKRGSTCKYWAPCMSDAQDRAAAELIIRAPGKARNSPRIKLLINQGIV